MNISPISKILDLVGYKILHQNIKEKPPAVVKQTADYTVELSEEGIKKNNESRQQKVSDIKKSVDLNNYEIDDDMADKIAESITSAFIRDAASYRQID